MPPEKTASTPDVAKPDAVATPDTPSEQPKTLLEAISADLDKKSADAKELNPDAGGPEKKEPAADDSANVDEAADDAAGKDGEAKPKADAKPDEKKVDEKKPDAKAKADESDEDLLKEPEGLTEKSSKRFQKLANKNKEITAKFEEANSTVTAFQEFMGEHKVGQEQFEQAVSIIGLINRQDFAGALKAIDEQRKTLVLLAGIEDKPVDPLDEYPEIKARVESMEIPRDVALKMARGEWIESQSKLHQQAEQQQQQTQQQYGQARDKALGEIDQFIAKQMKEDIDFKAKEKIVADEVVGWLQGIPPAQWLVTVQRMYGLLGKVRPAQRNEERPLRPSGGNGVGAPVPKTIHEAMFGPRV